MPVPPRVCVIFAVWVPFFHLGMKVADALAARTREASVYFMMNEGGICEYDEEV